MLCFDDRYVIHDLIIATSTSMYKLCLLDALAVLPQQEFNVAAIAIAIAIANAYAHRRRFELTRAIECLRLVACFAVEPAAGT